MTKDLQTLLVDLHRFGRNSPQETVVPGWDGDSVVRTIGEYFAKSPRPVAPTEADAASDSAREIIEYTNFSAWFDAELLRSCGEDFLGNPEEDAMARFAKAFAWTTWKRFHLNTPQPDSNDTDVSHPQDRQ